MQSPRRLSVIRQEAPSHEEISSLTKGHGLIALYALQQWEAFAPRYQTPLDHSYFYKHLQTFLAGLTNPTRHTAMKHLVTGACFVCGQPTVPTTIGDHLIARADGGPESIQNMALLCGPHNSSKGRKDLLAWWMTKAWPIAQLPRTILCLYCRIHWQHYGEAVVHEPIPEAMATFLLGRADLLPSDTHRNAVFGAAYAACAQVRWEKEPARHDLFS